eukprot:663379-Rhodomonas_salina.4
MLQLCQCVLPRKLALLDQNRQNRLGVAACCCRIASWQRAVARCPAVFEVQHVTCCRDLDIAGLAPAVPDAGCKR